jgi:hypothetical protein
LVKQSLQRVVVDATMMDKAKIAFMERLEKKKVLAQVIDFSKYKK